VEIRGNKPRPKEQVSRRMLHYNELYFSKLSDILAELPMKMSGANDTYSNLLSGAVMHITRVEVTKDLLRARVRGSILHGKEEKRTDVEKHRCIGSACLAAKILLSANCSYKLPSSVTY
jgi:hypothetical protein